MRTLDLKNCLGLNKIDRNYHISAGDTNPSTGKAYAINPSSGVWDDNYFAKNFGNQGSSSSPTSTGGQQRAVTDTANQAQDNFNALRDTNQKNVTDFLANYKSDTANAIQGANQQFHIPEQTGMANALNSRISQLSGNTDNSGAGGYASTGQVDAAINSRYLPQLNAAQSNLNTSATLAQQQEGIALQPDKDYGNLLATNIQSSMQGLTSTEQAVLAAIEENLKQGVSLTEQQVTIGNQVSQAVLDRAQALTIEKLKQQYQPLSSGQRLYELGTTNGSPSAQIIANYSNPSV